MPKPPIKNHKQIIKKIGFNVNTEDEDNPNFKDLEHAAEGLQKGDTLLCKSLPNVMLRCWIFCPIIEVLANLKEKGVIVEFEFEDLILDPSNEEEYKKNYALFEGVYFANCIYDVPYC